MKALWTAAAALLTFMTAAHAQALNPTMPQLLAQGGKFVSIVTFSTSQLQRPYAIFIQVGSVVHVCMTRMHADNNGLQEFKTVRCPRVVSGKGFYVKN